MWNLLNIVFNIIGAYLLFQFIRSKVYDYQILDSPKKFWTYRRHKYIITVGGFLLAAFGLIFFLLPESTPFSDLVFRTAINNWVGIMLSLSISLIWAVYLRKLDVFDPERWINIFIVFALGAATVWLVFPMTTFLKNTFDFRLNGDVWNDFIYCVVGIGMIEEFVKLVPLLVIIRFKKVVREPYDFVLYASVAALGFAVVENALYIIKTNFYSTNGRALMATVAHMTFSSVIGYSVMIAIYKKHWTGWKYLAGGFLLASLMHGFYDFWLLNPTASLYNGLTFLFFMLTTHFWFTMKNKTINASRFFDPHRKLINDKLRFFLIFWFTGLLTFSVLVVGLFHGRAIASQYLNGQLFAYGFLLYYLSFSFSRYKLAPKLLNAGQKAFDAVIPNEPEGEVANWGAE
ncbi:MAG: PrsW family glutamic-type intramembrane protease [Salibacteraceae bacterium]